ncbi:permease [Aneurinibacillus migulanus]|uniref:purine/pyrimidine permease n=1 Tax=Aneurinibacillus migulanus TaxID=47500 RepID=UPI0005BA3F83|nr:purine/pyrimidine permease [Aneurinibacillus migulanus]KIV50769.1 permease [Aneurinibacillus migulanus]KPD09189.1 permease [Aneurinibacillus migulanus]MCP1358556.1 purine/pyrimidine permease [Aneurinibacillus migulanus]
MESEREATKNLYGLDEKPPISVTMTAALQWFFITLSSSLVVPLVIGEMYGLSPQQVGQFVQQTFFLIGLVSLLQILFGHKLPITEGPAGMWWGIFIILVNLGTVAGQAPQEIGQSLEMGLIITGIMLIILGATGFIEKVQRIFTPLVSGGYLILLAVSLSGPVMNGMLGIGYFSKESGVEPVLAMVSIGLVFLTFIMIRSPFKYVRSFAILISMIIGWLIYLFMDWTKPLQEANGLFELPQPFFWGPPVFHLGTVLTSLVTGLILITNLVASIAVVSHVANIRPREEDYRRGGIMTGVAHLLSGFGGIVGLVPLSISAGVIQVSRIAARLPFIIAAIMLILLGVLSPVSRILAGLPSPVGYAVMFVTYTQLLGFGLRDFGRIILDERNVLIIGFGLLGGIGLMFVPPEALQVLPPIFSYIFGNGLVMGVLLIIFMEQVVFRSRPH